MTVHRTSQGTILQVASGTSIYGGEKILLSLSNYLRERGYRVIILSPGEGELAKLSRKLGYKVTVISLKKTYNFMAMIRLAHFLKREKVDLVHSHGLLVNIISRLASFLSGCKTVNTIHVIQHLSNGSNSLYRKIKNIYYRILDNFTARFCQKVMAVSKAVEGDLIRQGLGREKVVTIPNGLSIGRPKGLEEGGSFIKKDKAVLSQFGLGESDRVVGLVGRIVPLKGHDDFISAARILAPGYPGIKFLIVGEELVRGGRYSKFLKERVKKEGLEERVIFTGFLKSTKEIMANFDILTLVSWEEPFGLVILEAMSMGVPVIATHSGGVPEIIRDGENGLLIPPRSPEALSQAILKILDDRTLAGRLAESGLKTVKNYTVDKMARAIENIYHEVLGG